MRNVLLLCDGANPRTDYLIALIEKNYTVEFISDAAAVTEAIRTRSESIFALIIDHPSGTRKPARSSTMCRARTATSLPSRSWS